MNMIKEATILHALGVQANPRPHPGTVDRGHVELWLASNLLPPTLDTKNSALL